MTGKLNNHTDGVERSTDFIVNYVKKELKPLSEWMVDVSDLEDVGGDLISRGSESVRWFRQKGNGKVIAGKAVIADDSGEGNEQEFKREISSLVSLDHPCVVKFAGCALLCSLTDHRFLIFTEYVSGGSLSVVIEDPARFAWFNSAGRTSVGLGCYSETRRNNHQCLSIASVRPCLFFARGDLLDPPDITLRPLFPFSPQQPQDAVLPQTELPSSLPRSGKGTQGNDRLSLMILTLP